MARVKIHLFGEVRVYRDEKPIVLPTQKMKSLFAYLLTHRDRGYPPELLAGTFWGETSEEKARDSLNNALSVLRRSLPNSVITEYGNIRFNPKIEYWLDVEAFEERVAQAKRLDPQDAARAAALEEAVALYGGDFLEGFYEDWALFEQERLQNIYVEALQELMMWHKNRKAYAQAIECARKLLARQRFSEETHRELMALYALSSNREAALRQYKECCTILKEELNAEPLPETHQLYEKLQRQPVWVLEELTPIELKYPEILAPFVGRGRELQLLLNHWHAAEQGRGHIILINGEAGVGKSRLVQELMNHVAVRQSLILMGSCQALSEALPYQPLVEALRGRLQKASAKSLQKLSNFWLIELAKLVPEILEKLPRLKEKLLHSATEPEKARLFEALTQLFCEIAREQPLLLFLDDLHWADRATLEYLTYLARRISEQRVLLMGTYRTEEVHEKHPLLELMAQLGRQQRLTRVNLNPLSVEELAQLLTAMLKSEQPAFNALIYQETEGNPFFAIALMKSLMEAGALVQEAQGSWKLSVEEITPDLLPQSVRALIQTRLRRVSPIGRQLLDVAAVVGKAFEFSVLQRLISRQEGALLDTLDSLLKAALIVEEEDSRYAFSHELIRQVVYGELSVQRRRYLHLRVAQALEILYAHRLDEISGELAHHFDQAQAWREALKYLLQAGAQAKRAYANHEALGFFGRALSIIDQLVAARKLRQKSKERLLVKRFDVLKERVEIYQLLGRLPEQEPDLAEMFVVATKLKDLKYTAEAHSQKSEFCQMAGCYPEGKQEAKRALAIYRKVGARKAEGLALRRLGFVYESLGEYAQALKCYRQAYKILIKTRDKQGEAAALTRMATMFWSLGDVQKALESAQKSNEIFKELGDLARASDALTSMAIVYDNVGQDEKALEYNTQALKLRQEVGDRRREAAALNNLGEFYRDRGDFVKALEYLTRALPLWQETGYKRGEAATLSNLGVAYGELGEYQRASACFDQSLQISRELNLKDQEIENLIWRSRLDLALGNYQDAYERSKQAMALLEASGYMRYKPRAYWGHFKVLKAMDRAKEAATYLQKAYRELMAEANKLKDKALRESFLTNVQTNREIMKAWEALQSRRSNLTQQSRHLR